MAWGRFDRQPTVGRRWNPQFAIHTVFLIATTFLFSAAEAATLPHKSLQRRAPIGDGVELRVLPIGDSITWGAQSSDDNGYRRHLREMLVARGNDVDMVGGEKSGNFLDWQHEGHRGFFIEGISDSSDKGIYAAPNVVLLHAGTNDMYKNVDVGNAPARLEALINKIYKHSENAAVFVCQIIPSKTASIQARIDDFNPAIPSLVSKLVKDGKHVTLVKMNEALSAGPDLKDFLHPNDGGYVKMANTWYDAIKEADDKGWIVKPGKAQTPPTSTNPANCRSTPSWYKVGKIANGAKVATTDGDFQPVWGTGYDLKGPDCPRKQVRFLDINGDGFKDYACVDPDTGSTMVWLNNGDKDGGVDWVYDSIGEVAKGAKGRKGAGVFFADLNGDGRDDYIYVDDEGDVYAWINRLKSGKTWQWQDIGRIAGGVGATSKNLQMADIDGDGRADFLIVSPSKGEVTSWLNTGADITPDYYKLGVIATGATASSGDTVIMGDLTGEGRADYMVVGDGGKVNALINRLQADTLVPRWLSSFTLAEGPAGAEQDEVRLVDLTGDGKVDYIRLNSAGNVKLYKNNGSGGKYQPGEGVILCDLDGDGTSDYFWLDHKGRGWGYLNIGQGSNKWKDLGQVTNGPVRDRSTIRMGVLTHSKRADYITVDEETGKAMWWQNLGSEWDWGWSSQGEAAAGPRKTIEDTYGWNFRGRNVRFADLDGDGFDDYLYVNDQGAVVMWKNLGTNPITWGLPHLIADGVGVLARQVQFADTDGDGKLDYNVVGSTTGRVQSWHNLGRRDDGSIRWNTPLSFADGTGPGFTIRISEMTGDKRADYVAVNPDNGALTLWHNRCDPIPGSDNDDNDGGDDDDDDDDDGDADTDAHPDVTDVTVHWGDNSCQNKGYQTQIETEMAWARAMAAAAEVEPEKSSYYEHFFYDVLRNNPAFPATIQTRFKHMKNMLSGTHQDYKFEVTCDDTTTDFCKRGYMAHFNDRNKRLNFCNAFFKSRPIPNDPTRVSLFAKSALNSCSRQDLKFFQRSKAAILVHEMSHSRYAMNGPDKARDYAYGYDGCTRFPIWRFDRSCAPYANPHNVLCPDAAGVETTCNPVLTELNADTYSFVAAGIFFSKKCGKAVLYPTPKFPPLSVRGIDIGEFNETMENAVSTGLQPRQEGPGFCPAIDYIAFDPEEEDEQVCEHPIQTCGYRDKVVGYAHFGDSYASGMGTGTTTGNPCRVGSNNYGQLIYDALDDSSVVWPGALSCSGDTTDYLWKKIEKWDKAANTNLATLTIGGNDVWFSDLAIYCVLRPYPWQDPKENDRKCDEFKHKARDHMRNTSDDGLPAKLRKSYQKIMEKSYDARRGNSLDLYVAGYSKFFNENTDDCENSSFDYWHSDYKGKEGDDIVKLTKLLRSDLNSLVDELNGVISDAIDTFNNGWSGERVHYVSVTDSFEADPDHRWCSHEDVHEPVKDRKDTWFFLSLWDDNDDTTASADQAESERLALAAQGQVALPSCDANSPLNDFAGNDPWDVYMCRFAQAVADDSNGVVAKSLEKANAALSDGDYQSTDIDSWIPTNRLKTFHPRTRGMQAYKNAILASMKADGKL